MKNIFDLLKEYGVELPEDKKKDFEKALLENYKTVKDYDAQKDKLATAEAKVTAHETTIKGRNAKAIRALLDVDTLKASKNQKDDVAAAIKALTEAEDSRMLFGEDEPAEIGSVIATVGRKTGAAEDAAMRAAMGLPPVKSE